MSDQSKAYVDQYTESALYDSCWTRYEAPLTIDAGSTFTTPDGVRHTDACGWLAIWTCMRVLNIKTEYESPSTGSWQTPLLIKESSQCYSSDSKITDEELALAAVTLNVQIHKHEANYSEKFGNGGEEIHIYLYCGHYYAMFDKKRFKIEGLRAACSELGESVSALGARFAAVELANEARARLAAIVDDEDYVYPGVPHS